MHCLCATIRNVCCHDQTIISHATCTLCSSVMKLEVHSVGLFLLQFKPVLFGLLIVVMLYHQMFISQLMDSSTSSYLDQLGEYYIIQGPNSYYDEVYTIR